MTETRTLLAQALDALEAMQMEAKSRWCGLRIADEAIDALRAALAQPQAEPVAWRFKLDGDLQWQHTDKWQILPGFGTVEPLYATPQQAQPAPAVPAVQPLTDEQIMELHTAQTGWSLCPAGIFRLVRAIEQAHGIAAPGSKP